MAICCCLPACQGGGVGCCQNQIKFCPERVTQEEEFCWCRGLEQRRTANRMFGQLSNTSFLSFFSSLLNGSSSIDHKQATESSRARVVHCAFFQSIRLSRSTVCFSHLKPQKSDEAKRRSDAAITVVASKREKKKGKMDV